LTASMTHMVGVFDMEAAIEHNLKHVVISSQKDRELGSFQPMGYGLHPAGWFKRPAKGHEYAFDPAQGMKAVEKNLGTHMSSKGDREL